MSDSDWNSYIVCSKYTVSKDGHYLGISVTHLCQSFQNVMFSVTVSLLTSSFILLRLPYLLYIPLNIFCSTNVHGLFVKKNWLISTSMKKD